MSARVIAPSFVVEAVLPCNGAAALKITLIIDVIAVWLVHDPWFNRLTAPVTFVIAEVSMLGWLAKASNGLGQQYRALG